MWSWGSCRTVLIATMRKAENYWQRKARYWCHMMTDNRSEGYEVVKSQSWLTVLTLQLIETCGRILRLVKGALGSIGSRQRNADAQS